MKRRRARRIKAKPRRIRIGRRSVLIRSLLKVHPPIFDMFSFDLRRICNEKRIKADFIMYLPSLLETTTRLILRLSIGVIGRL